ncbi:pyrroline-5-carboxylate reductase [bacterium]|jgi:pyrroline-5-carboxylate reductase|nr:pyrroline-5-carboxylate reductase [bacterium]MBT3850290.1 pyrroline-5-carboxylate reductase [bacterium]
MRIGLIGSGNMAGAILDGLLSDKKKHQIICSDIDKKKLTKIKKDKKILVTTDNTKVVEESELIFICVKPDAVKEVMACISEKSTPTQIFVSVAAGVKINFIEDLLGGDKKIIRTMPNLGCLVSEGVIAYKANPNCLKQDVKSFLALISKMGETLEIKKESDFDYVTAISGSGPAFLAEYISSQLKFAKSKKMNTRDSRLLIYKTILGTVKYFDKTNTSPADFIKMVSSRGGTTIEGLKVLKNKKFNNTIIKCLDSTSRKSAKIAKILGEKKK